MPTTWYCPRCFTTFAEEVDRCANLACRLRQLREGWPRLLEPSDVIDRNYVVIEFVALGGAGITYRARELDDAGAPRPPDLAIKVLHTRRNSGAFLRRLSNEARILQELNHENMVQCWGFVHRAGRSPYLVTRFEGGGNLEDFVNDVGPLPPHTVAGIMAQVFDALATAHPCGVIHRDLKPANLLIEARLPKTEVPHVRVADFGIAKVSGGLTASMTRTGAFVGTPQYAAPEQFLGTPTTPATDVYSAGAVAAFLAMGRPYADLKQSGDIHDYYMRVIDALPPRLPDYLMRSRKAVHLQDLLAGTMAVDPADRWSVAHARDWLDFILDRRQTRPQLSPETQITVDDPAESTDESDADTAIFLRQAAPPKAAPPKAASPRPPVSPAPTRPPAARTAPPMRSPPPRRPPSGPSMAHVAPPDATVPEDLALDDLLGATTAFTDEPPRQRAPSTPAPPFVPPAAADFDVPHSGAVAWLPNPLEVLPDTLPDDVVDLLRVLATTSPDGRRRIVSRLLSLDPQILGRAVTTYKNGTDPAWGRGIGLAVEHIGRPEWETTARSLLSDEDPGVRTAAVAALARVGELPAMQTIAGVLQDADARVRAAAVRTLAALARIHGRRATAIHMLRPLAHDPDALVQRFVNEALVDLE